MSSIDIDGNEVPEEIDMEEEVENDDDNDNFAQSMPAQYTGGAPQVKQQYSNQQQFTLHQSMN